MGLGMVSTVRSASFQGIEVREVEVQAQLAAGLPAFTVVGLPDKAVAESRERVRAALTAMGLALPPKKIVINLAPADLVKEGSHFDLPIALALLAALGVVPDDAVSGYWALGELALDGRILPVAGILPAAMGAVAHGAGLICPQEGGSEARWAGEGLSIIAAPSLLAITNHFKGLQVLHPPVLAAQLEDAMRIPDLREVRGQETAKRALEITAAGGHNLLMVGPPGAGKSMLASCLPGLLPPLTAPEMLEVSVLQSVAGKLVGGQLTTRRAFRDPHHSSSMAAMVGGGRKAMPGEISLAHLGVLFLDELPEFPRGVLESMRQPLETGTVSVARAASHVTYPARFQLIAAMNPCRCGYLTEPERACNKAPRCGSDYQARLSGPFLDRIDLRIDMPGLDTRDMLRGAEGEASATVAARVAKARGMQQHRYAAHGIRTNAEASGELLQQAVAITTEARELLEKALENFKLSMRGYVRTLRVARTIADLAGEPEVTRPAMAEALSYRTLVGV